MGMAQKESISTYTGFAKPLMHVLRSNSTFVATSEDLMRLPVAYICRDFFWTIKKLNSNIDEPYKKVINIQLKILAEIFKILPDNSKGMGEMLVTIWELECYSQDENFNPYLAELILIFKNVWWQQRHSSFFFKNFFKQIEQPSDGQLNLLYQKAIEVVDDMKENQELLNIALPSQESSNYCWLLLQSMSENPQLIHVDPNLHDRLILKIVELLCADKNFRFIEKLLMKGIVGTDFWMSSICFEVLLGFLAQYRSEIIGKYFTNFVKLLKNLWKPSAGVSTIPQLYVMSIVKFIINRHPQLANQKHELEVIKILLRKPNAEASRKFQQAFQSMIRSPTASNYYATVTSLQELAINGLDNTNQEAMADFGSLISMTAECDWNLHSTMIISILDAIASTADVGKKIVLMLKLNPVLTKNPTMPLQVKIKLLAMLCTYIPSAQSKYGLTLVLIRELNRLLTEDDDLIMKRAVVSKLGELIGDNVYQTAAYLQEITLSLKFDDDLEVKMSADDELKILKKSKGLKRAHDCIAIDHRVESEPSITQNLQHILDFSKQIESHRLTNVDKEIIRVINSNFEMVLNKRPKILNGM